MGRLEGGRQVWEQEEELRDVRSPNQLAQGREGPVGGGGRDGHTQPVLARAGPEDQVDLWDSREGPRASSSGLCSPRVSESPTFTHECRDGIRFVKPHSLDWTLLLTYGFWFRGPQEQNG